MSMKKNAKFSPVLVPDKATRIPDPVSSREDAAPIQNLSRAIKN